ncbi:MAG: response regulator [Planctomycetes bacterium]|nr:response regulator [Planctomycetota bacterium]
MPPVETSDSMPPGAAPHQILLVEDDAQTAALLKQQLEERGFKVNIARDGGQAQSTFVMRKPDFVIVDLILPGESGFEVCERLKQTDSNVPVMVLSVIDMADARRLAERVGADGYVTKPCPPDRLAAEIMAVAERVWQETHLGHSRESDRVRFSCRCGKRFKVSAAHRGKTLTCPSCGEPVHVPRHE